LQSEAGAHDAERADDGAADAIDRSGHCGDTLLHGVGAHGRTVGVERAAECGTHGGVVQGDTLTQPAHVPHRMLTGFHCGIHGVGLVGGLGEVRRFARGLRQCHEDRFGQPGECGSTSERASNAQQFAAWSEPTFAVSRCESGRFQ